MITTINLKKAHIITSLNALQLKSIGKKFGNDVYQPLFIGLHPAPNDESFYEDEDDQTFDDFKRCGKRNPNELGTGRWKLTLKRNRILVLCASNKANYIKWSNELCLILKPYFQLDVDIEFIDELSFKMDDKCYIEKGTKHNLNFINIKKSTKHKKKTVEIVDVFSLFDIFCKKSCMPYITTILLVDFNIGEINDEEAYEVLGRACGDRICCVSFLKNKKRRDFFSTCLHELCHTIGFDHCKSFKCVMNAIATESTLFLSPPNLRKLKLFLSIPDSNTSFLLERYEQLLVVFHSLSNKEEFQEDIVFIELKCNIMRLAV